MSDFTKIPGLKELPEDGRDFALGGVFGFIDLAEVPDTDFIVCEPLTMKNQGDSDQCSAFTVTEVSEDQEGIELMPAYQFYSTKRITGNKDEWGADLRSACKSATKYGSLPVKHLPDMQNQSRAFILEESNWPATADQVAQMYRKETYFSITGKYDLFDNIRCALWQNRNSKSTIVTGAIWKSIWIDAKNGIIPEGDGAGFGHAFKIFGQKVINGELYLVAQLSNGTETGDKGLYYFNRAIANKEIGRFGLFMFKDISKEDAEYYLKQPFTINTPFLKVIFNLIINFLKKI